MYNIDTIIIFIIFQMINVILSTIKSVVTISASRWTASYVNTISYTFGAAVMKLITAQPFEVVITVTIITNLIGVYIGRLITDKRKPVKLWTITATLKEDVPADIEDSLKKRSIQYTLLSALNNRHLITIFAYTKAESALIKEILDAYNVPFAITENRDTF